MHSPAVNLFQVKFFVMYIRGVAVDVISSGLWMKHGCGKPLRGDSARQMYMGIVFQITDFLRRFDLSRTFVKKVNLPDQRSGLLGAYSNILS